ncbi:DNA ligase [candidate division TA06 bacterium SM1_40]|uniref:DNA ligase n=2 Tax=Bacteria division TA06 TaxID=1156500 RepID=A0A0S8JH63_UNCT6|nr:MAG: DNA ligase [candidate division TA06 bacterium SM23_40]KPL09071.1 MAG: DNA ligase [candidate division TA06 bacterium SM1_40]
MAGRRQLKRYREKRDFRRSPEPSGGGREPSGQPIFVIQKHAARTLHYDFRLEVGGVLKSWAVPKGPSTDPRQRRLAVPTEDHPIEYAEFEGVIPDGEYGAGTVLVWDAGTYRNLRAEKEGDGASMEQAIEQGMVEIWLDGKKLRGGYALVRTGGGDDRRWLLVKMKDEWADARRRPTSTEPESVLTGRTLEQIAREEVAGSSEDP